MDYSWVHSSAYSSIPPNAVIGGNDTDGAVIYVGRSFHNGDMLVAKVIPSKQIAFVSWRGDEFPKEHFEILCGTQLVWRHCYDHVVPENAVSCGTTSLDQPVYIGRGHWEGSLTVGKVSSVHRSLFIPFGGTERRLETYEILLNESDCKPGWAIASPTTPLPPPPPSIVESEKLYPVPPPFETKPPLGSPSMPFPPPIDVKPSLYPPPYTTGMPKPPQFGVPVFPTAPSHVEPPSGPPPPYFATPEIYPPPPPFSYTKPQRPEIYPPPLSSCTTAPMPAEVYMPSPSSSSYTKPQRPENYPPPLSSCTTAPTPAEVYMPSPSSSSFTKPHRPEIYPPPLSSCTTPRRPHDLWMAASASYQPVNAVVAGHDTDLSTLYVSRAFHDGALIPGKAVPSRGCAYISHDGQEVPKTHYEILVGDTYHWVPAQDGNIAPGAVEAGRSGSGEPLFVGRAHHCGSLTPGKIQRSHQCLYIPFGGSERRISQYEVLVRREDYYRDQAMMMQY